MDDLGLLYSDAIFIGEDNTAAQMIAHAGKLTRNVRHIATKAMALQEHERHERVVFGSVTSKLNCADHFTTALPSQLFYEHCSYTMGPRPHGSNAFEQHENWLILSFQFRIWGGCYDHVCLLFVDV